jgi:hypothetical protein
VVADPTSHAKAPRMEKWPVAAGRCTSAVESRSVPRAV